MHSSEMVFTVQDGINALCELLPGFAKNGPIEIRDTVAGFIHGLITGEIRSACLVLHGKDGGQTIIVIGDTREEQLKVIETSAAHLREESKNMPVPSATIIQFPSRA